MLNINIYNFRNFSATNGKNKYSSISPTDREVWGVLLPCINDKTEFMNSLKSSLPLVDKDNKSLSYKLEYCLYLYTNDENKVLVEGPDNDDSLLDSNKYSEDQILNHSIALEMFEDSYEYKGYYVVHTDLYDPELVLDLDGYVKNVLYILGKYVIHINETLNIFEFVNFKKSTILKITKINKSNKSNKSNSFDLIKDNDGIIKSNINTKFINYVSNSCSVLRSKRFYSTSLPCKLVVNSTFYNIVFIDNKSILFLPGLHIDSYLFEMENQMENLDIPIPFFENLSKVFGNLDKGLYRFDLYLYIESSLLMI